MYQLDSIVQINMELSSFCNAKCPQCQRFDVFGNVHRDLNQQHLEFNVIKKLPIEKMTKLRTLSFIGNFGDPLMNPDLDNILEFFTEYKIYISTNASLRPLSWWANVARKHKNLQIAFCIDGLEDTHSLYRRNTDYKKIINNAKSFIDNGGHALWQFIVFKHNEHQKNDAEKMAKQLGFKEIFYINSDRFDTDDKWRVFDGNKYQYTLEKATEAKTLRSKFGSKDNEKYWKNMFLSANKTNIECIWAKNREIYIHSDGTVLPCCHMGHITAGNHLKARLLEKIIKDWSNVNLYQKKFIDIINGPWYKEYFEQSLANKAHPVCIEYCDKKVGKYYNPV